MGWEEAERLKPKTFQGHNHEKIDEPSNRIQILDVGEFQISHLGSVLRDTRGDRILGYSIEGWT